MSLPPTLRRSFSARTGAVAALLLVGVVYRFALAFPAHKYPADADCVGSALCAFDVLRGETPVFMIAERLGAVSCYVTALSFRLFGVSRSALALGPAVVGCLLLGAWYLFLRELLGRDTARVALPLIAVPAPAFAFWTYMPNTYPETLLCCAAALWLAARVARGATDRPTLFGLGLAAGVGWWSSMISLSCTGPALAWAACRRPGLAARPASVLLVAAGLVAGAFPWLAFNLRHPLRSFGGQKVAPAESPAALLENLEHLFTYKLPELLGGHGHGSGEDGLEPLLGGATLAVTAAAAAVVFLAPALPRRWRPARLAAGWRSPPWLLFTLIAAAVLALNVVAAAGQLRGPTVRYVLPLYLIVPGLLAIFLTWIAGGGPARGGPAGRVLAGALLGAVLAFHLAGSHLPGSDERRLWARQADADGRLLAFLESQQVDAVIGRFWLVYPLSFLSREAILGLPVEPGLDLNRVTADLPAAPIRWALVAWREDDALACAERAGLEGTLSSVAAPYVVFLPRGRPTEGEKPLRFLRRIQAACHPPPAG